MLVKKTNNYKVFSMAFGSLVPSTLIVYREFPIYCLTSLVTTQLIAAISSFGISGLMYVAFRGIVLMISS